MTETRGGLYTIDQLITILPRVSAGGVDFILSGNSSKSITSGVRYEYVEGGSSYHLLKKRVPRTISVSNAEFVVGDAIASLGMGEIVNVDGMNAIVRSVSPNGFSAEEVLPSDD